MIHLPAATTPSPTSSQPSFLALPLHTDPQITNPPTNRRTDLPTRPTDRQAPPSGHRPRRGARLGHQPAPGPPAAAGAHARGRAAADRGPRRRPQRRRRRRAGRNWRQQRRRLRAEARRGAAKSSGGFGAPRSPGVGRRVPQCAVPQAAAPPRHQHRHGLPRPQKQGAAAESKGGGLVCVTLFFSKPPAFACSEALFLLITTPNRPQPTPTDSPSRSTGTPSAPPSSSPSTAPPPAWRRPTRSPWTQISPRRCSRRRCGATGAAPGRRRCPRSRRT